MNLPPYPVAVAAKVGLEPPDPGYAVLTIVTRSGQPMKFALTEIALRQLAATVDTFRHLLPPTAAPEATSPKEPT